MVELIDTSSAKGGQLNTSFMQKIMEQPTLLYESLLRNGFVLPDYRSALCNHQYLIDVRLGKVFCFKDQDVSFKNMVHKLTTKDLNERLREGLSDTFLKHDYWKDQAERDRV
jgi:hypothetical protein